jgi:hypothetical protein
MSYIWPILVSLILAACLYLSLKIRGFTDRLHDWRHGLAVDRTGEWQSLEKLFKEQE